MTENREYPKYSVLMSLYAKENPRYLKEAIDSMLSQTVLPDEIILVEDGPLTDELYRILDGYSTSITRIKSEQNLGLGKALNLGLQYCRNEYVARMDTDDIALPTRCEEELKIFLKEPKLSVVGSIIDEFITEPEKVISRRIVPKRHEEIAVYIKTRCPFNHMTVIFKKSAVEQAGGYQDWHYNEDYYLWIRMFQKGMFFQNSEKSLVKMRVGEDMYRRRGGWKYFKSEAKLQKYMRKNKIIGFKTYFLNICKRFIVQVLLPNRLRGWVFKKFARNSVKG